MSRPRNPSGTRRATTYTRNGKTVHARQASIKGRQAPKRRLNAAAKRRAQRKPLLAGAAGLLGLGALDAILMGRWGGFLVLGSLAVGLGITHFAWQWHKNRQAAKPARQSAAEQRRQALAKARMQTKMAAARKWAFSKEGLKAELGIGNPSRPVEPAGTRRAPAKNGGWKQPPLSSDDSVEPIGPRSDPPKRAVQQSDGTTANLYTPRRVGLDPPVLISDGAPTTRGAHLLSAEEAHAYTASTEPSSPPEKKSYDTPQKDVGTFKLSAAQAKALGGGWKAGDKQCNAHGSGRSAGCPSCRSIGAPK